jgi:hypothetical protein
MIKVNYLQSSIRLHGTSSRKFFHSNRFILQNNLPACWTDSVLPKYGDNSARCKSFGPYFNNIELTRPTITILRMPGQPGFLYTVGIYRRGRKTPLIHSMQIAKSGTYNGKQRIYCRTVYSTYVFSIRNVFKTIYDVYHGQKSRT